ncbi:DUF5979 domain-containing protein [Luteimicrobium album]|nr:DUF5979 domain-containing protein [Luteimicrobium album]
MVIEDVSPTFWNQYDLSSLTEPDFTHPIDRVQVDAFTGATFTTDGDGNLVATGGSWTTGSPSATAALPDGVNAADVQGLRFTFTRADEAAWENPASPNQPVKFQVVRRAELRSGGPLETDQADHQPAPSETKPGVATNDITTTVTSNDVDSNGPLTASADTSATITYKHLANAVSVSKSPNGNLEQPGAPFPYTLTIKNSGLVPIVDPVVTDRLPSDPQGPLLVFDPNTSEDDRYTYDLQDPVGDNDSPMPTDSTQVTVDVTNDAGTGAPTSIRWTFPAGTTLEPGETYTITFPMQTRVGLPSDTKFTNSFGVVGDRPWDECDGELDAATGECRASATNSVLEGGALGVRKAVKAEGSDELGVLTDPLTTADPADCKADAQGYYARPCVPIAVPGGAVDWQLRYQNTGNLPIDEVSSVDRLPALGDQLATAPLDRGSEWRPVLSGEKPTLASGDGTLTVYFTDDGPDDFCADGVGTSNPLSCGSWTEWTDAAAPDPATATGLLFVFDPTTPLQPTDTFSVNVPMKAPAQSQTVGEDRIAYNTVGASGEAVRPNGQTLWTLTTEPPRVGVALATARIQVVKEVTGPAADTYAPGTFRATVDCTSVGEPVDLGDQGTVTLTPNEPLTISGVPYHADCTVSEGDNGQTSSTVNHVVAERTTSPVVPLVTLTNDYQFASLDITKSVDSPAVDQDGTPVAYGPFHVTVDCTFLGDPVYADGYSADNPMEATIADGDTLHLTGLPAGASCDVTEDDAHGAVTTTHDVTPAGGDESTTDGDSATVELAPTTDGTNTDVVHNTFADGSSGSSSTSRATPPTPTAPDRSLSTSSARSTTSPAPAPPGPAT